MYSVCCITKTVGLVESCNRLEARAGSVESHRLEVALPELGGVST